MKYFRKLFLALCAAVALTLPQYSVSAENTNLEGRLGTSNIVLCEEVDRKLSDRISILEESLKKHAPYVKVFDGLAVKEELGVKIKVFQKKTEQKTYHYFLMATADKYTDGSSKDRFLLLDDLAFSFDKEICYSRLDDHSALRASPSNGRARGTTFILNDSDKEFYAMAENNGWYQFCLTSE